MLLKGVDEIENHPSVSKSVPYFRNDAIVRSYRHENPIGNLKSAYICEYLLILLRWNPGSQILSYNLLYQDFNGSYDKTQGDSADNK